MKLSFCESKDFIGRGVDIPLLSSATPKQIVNIGKYYEGIGWFPSKRTQRALSEASKKVVKRKRNNNSEVK